MKIYTNESEYYEAPEGVEFVALEEAEAVVAFAVYEGSAYALGYAAGRGIPAVCVAREFEMEQAQSLFTKAIIKPDHDDDEVIAEAVFLLEMERRQGFGREAAQAWWKAADRRTPRAFLKGYVYLLQAGDDFKIGRTEVIDSRVERLTIQLPVKPSLVHVVRCDCNQAAERFFHAAFQHRRQNGEWFSLTAAEVEWFKGFSEWKMEDWL